LTAVILAGCSLLTDLEGLDIGSSPPGLDSGQDGTTGPLADGDASSSSSSGGGNDAAPDSPSGGCTIGTTNVRTPGVMGTTGDGPDWGVADNAKLEDAAGTTVVLTGSADESRYLLASNFAFNVPAGAEIRGVTVTIRGRAIVSTPVEANDVRDKIIRLAPDSAVAGTSVLGQKDEWSTAYSEHTAGGPTNTWGNTLTSAIVNAPAFGVGYLARFRANAASESATLEIDVVKVSITYCK